MTEEINENYWKEKYADVHIRLTNRIAELEQENAELKKENERLKKQLDSYAISATVPTVMYNRIEIERCKYGKALEEIREMCNKHLDAKEICYATQVIDKIDEVLGND